MKFILSKQDNSISTVEQKSVSSGEQYRQAIQRLQNQYPHATNIECTNFYTCVKFNEEAASTRLESYLKWRSECGLNTAPEAKGANKPQQSNCGAKVYDQALVKRDEDDWNDAAKMALSISTKPHASTSTNVLPQIVCSYEEKPSEGDYTSSKHHRNGTSSGSQPPRCKDGTRIFHFLPARLDLKLASTTVYSLAAALYLDKRLSRSSAERITLLVDIREGRGWPNPKPWSLLPFVQSVASLLETMYPDRLARLVLCPLPSSSVWAWGAAKKCLNPETVSKVVIVSAAETTSSSELPEALKEFIDEGSLNTLEERRRSYY